MYTMYLIYLLIISVINVTDKKILFAETIPSHQVIIFGEVSFEN